MLYLVVYAVAHPTKEGEEIICKQEVNSTYLSGAIRQAMQNEKRKITKIIRAHEA